MTKLLSALQAGKSIKGLKGFVPFGRNSGIHVPVTIKGLGTEDGQIIIRAAIAGATGEITIEPSDFVDDLRQLKKREEQEKKKQAYNNLIRSISRWSNFKQRKNALIEAFYKLPIKQRKEFRVASGVNLDTVTTNDIRPLSELLAGLATGYEKTPDDD